MILTPIEELIEAKIAHMDYPAHYWLRLAFMKLAVDYWAIGPRWLS